MAALIYILCTLTALVCSILLFRGYHRSRAGLLFWGALFFAGLALENLLLFVDRIVFLHVDLSMWRILPALMAVVLLICGLVWKKN